MNKKVVIDEIDEVSFKKEIVNVLNKEWSSFREDFFKSDCEIKEATINENNLITLYARVYRAKDNKPYPVKIEVSFEKDLEEDAKDNDYIVKLIHSSQKENTSNFNEDLDTYKVKGSLKEGILYCCR